MPPALTEARRRRGHDVPTVNADGRDNLGIPDDQALARPTQFDRAVITRNRRDFRLLHTSMRRHRRIVVIPQDNDTDGQADRIDASRAQLSLDDALVAVNRPSVP